DIANGAKCVGGGADGDEFCLRADFLFEVLPIERAGVGVHFYGAKGAASLFGERLPGTDVCVVVELGNDNFVVGSELASESAGDVKGERSCIRAEGDFMGCAAEKVGESETSVFEHFVGFVARRIVPVRVRVVMAEVVRDGVDHGLWDLG